MLTEANSLFGTQIGACGGFNVNSDHVVALPPLEYAGGTHCGRMVRIYYQGKSIDARAVDLCPSCGLTGLDLSISTFQALAPLDVGLIYVDWFYI
ncbi:hypothetical protein M413DRAFT_410304 [Hebeloma cylindrosporum]|uniref:RlpA-like protein double-psi beta-barrel domain-containing protein n=1 Tax=Hebeloma cylindrosporum TaxID=76867 RepID=A0A0C3CCB4_HEBCY|nr:hypothetical protein M413DRAFT_410304 [Hebeloma cylindrosporum h7]